jgi:hypothetical protein
MVRIRSRGRHLGTQCSSTSRLPTTLSSQSWMDKVMGIYSGPDVTRSLYSSLNSYSLLSLGTRMLPSYRRCILRPLKTIQQRGSRQLGTLNAGAKIVDSVRRVLQLRPHRLLARPNPPRIFPDTRHVERQHRLRDRSIASLTRLMIRPCVILQQRKMSLRLHPSHQRRR